MTPLSRANNVELFAVAPAPVFPYFGGMEYVAELAETREMLDNRYDDLKSGKVKPISCDELLTHFREKSAAARGTGPANDRL
jgi:hypothetical protein